jgi:hypothetical protein
MGWSLHHAFWQWITPVGLDKAIGLGPIYKRLSRGPGGVGSVVNDAILFLTAEQLEMFKPGHVSQIAAAFAPARFKLLGLSRCDVKIIHSNKWHRVFAPQAREKVTLAFK